MANEVQRFDIGGSPGSGKFTIGFRGAVTDPPLPYHPAAGDVTRALEALSTIGPGNVVCAKDTNWGYVLTFQNDLGDQDLPMIVVDGSLLGPGGTITASLVTDGSGDPDALEPSCATPCTLQHLQNWLRRGIVRAPGMTQALIITTDSSGIWVSVDENG
jgi:hypothetical protein